MVPSVRMRGLAATGCVRSAARRVGSPNTNGGDGQQDPCCVEPQIAPLAVPLLRAQHASRQRRRYVSTVVACGVLLRVARRLRRIDRHRCRRTRGRTQAHALAEREVDSRIRALGFRQNRAQRTDHCFMLLCHVGSLNPIGPPTQAPGQWSSVQHGSGAQP